MVKLTLKKDRVEVPENVTLEIKSKIITVEGPKGKLVKSFKQFPVQLITEKDDSGRISAVVIRVWFAKKKSKANVNSVKKHIQNMIDGVTRMFKTVMKYGYKFCVMKLQTLEDGKVLEIEKFAGRLEKIYVRAVKGVTMHLSQDEAKKEIAVVGMDVNSVGLTCQLINQSCQYRDLDRRIFLDGIYIFSRNFNE